MNKLSKIAKKVFYLVFILSVVLRIGIFVLITIESEYDRILQIIFNVLVPIVVFSFLVVFIQNFKKFGFLKGIRNSSFKIITLSFYLFLFVKLNSHVGYTNRIRFNIINETEFEISEFVISYTFGVTKITNTLASNKSKWITIYPTYTGGNNENDSKSKMILEYYCDEKRIANTISIELSKWNFIDKFWEIRIRNPDSIELLEI
tara:strand:- start:45767 stop:46378 length:612 start_codon:yes stop_codon:yes gene_type:complete